MIRSCRSLKKSNCLWITLVTLDKRATRRESLFSLLKKINVSDSLVIRSKKFVVFTMFLTVFHCFSPFYAQDLFTLVALRSVAIFKVWQERCFYSLYKCRSLKKNEIGTRSLEKSESLFHSFAHKNEGFARKAKERIPNPMNKKCYSVGTIFYLSYGLQ